MISKLEGVVVNDDGVHLLVETEPGVLTNPEAVVIRNGDFIEITYVYTVEA